MARANEAGANAVAEAVSAASRAVANFMMIVVYNVYEYLYSTFFGRCKRVQSSICCERQLRVAQDGFGMCQDGKRGAFFPWISLEAKRNVGTKKRDDV